MFKNTHIWLPSYIKQRLAPRQIRPKPVHIMFCFADHFEPRWENPSYETEVKRVDFWIKNYPELARKFKDSDGKHPQHTFFYPQEEYRPEHLEKLAKLCKEGFGEVEIHLHHDNDTPEGLRDKIQSFKIKLENHGLLSKDKDGKTRYGFIHGNWALCNSRRNGRMCGVNNELEILEDTGCYADFTLPSAPSETQTKKINDIYYAKNNPKIAKSHNEGIAVEVGKKPFGNLMLVQGPLALNWKRRKRGIIPRIENGEISEKNRPTKDRIDLWIEQNIHVKGKPDWIFVKVYAHGAQEGNFDTLLGEPIEKMFTDLGSRYNDGKQFTLHYVTTREMYNIIKAAEDGLNNNPNKYREYILKGNS